MERFRPRTTRLFATGVFGVVLLTSVVAGTAQQATVKGPSIAGPRIKFDEKTYDFGTWDRGGKITHAFKFRNVGNAPLKITRVMKTCGCLAVLTTAGTIEPGGEGEIKVTLDTGQYNGKMLKVVYVHSNDHITPIMRLTIKGTVRRLVFVSPRQVYINRKLRGEPITQRVEILWKREEPLDISSVTSSSKHITAKILRREELPHPRVVLQVAIGPDVPAGRLYETVRVHTRSKKCPTIDIPVVGIIEGEIKVAPPMFSFGSVQQGTIASRKLRVTKAREPNLRLEKVVSSLGFVETEVKEIVKGRSYGVNVKLRPDAPVGRIAGKIDIYTNSPEQPKITVSFTGAVRQKPGSRLRTRR